MEESGPRTGYDQKMPNPDPGGPKVYGSFGSGSTHWRKTNATLQTYKYSIAIAMHQDDDPIHNFCFC